MAKLNDVNDATGNWMPSKDDLVEMARLSKEGQLHTKVKMERLQDTPVEVLDQLILDLENTKVEDRSSRNYDFNEMMLMIEIELPGARYGFDYNPAVAVSRDKAGKLQKAPGQGWVRYKGIDWSVTHEIPAIAMMIAFVKVSRDLPRQEAYNKENAEKGLV